MDAVTIPLDRAFSGSISARGGESSSDLMLVAVEVRDLGAEIGHGVYAAEPIAEGTTVAAFGGIAMRAADFDQADEDRRSGSIQIDDDVFLVPTGRPAPATLINHSCEPTCRLDGQVLVVAARDIVPGEALTYDYATSDAAPYDEFECACGTPSCRGKVTGDDWMLPELRERYAGWFSPYIARKIARLTDR